MYAHLFFTPTLLHSFLILFGMNSRSTRTVCPKMLVLLASQMVGKRPVCPEAAAVAVDAHVILTLDKRERQLQLQL